MHSSTGKLVNILIISLLTIVNSSCQDATGKPSNTQSQTLHKGDLKPNWSNRYFSVNLNSFVTISMSNEGGQITKGMVPSFSPSVYYFEDDQLLLDLDVYTKSFQMGIPALDSIIQNESWLNAKSEPKVFFKAKSSLRTANGYEITGDFYLNGITREEKLLVTPTDKNRYENGMDYLMLDGTLTVNRKKYNIPGTVSWNISPWRANFDSNPAQGGDLTLEFNLLIQRWTKEWAEKRWETPNSDGTPNVVGSIYAIVKEKGAKAGIKKFESMEETDPETINNNILGYVAFILTLGEEITEKEFKDAETLFKYNIKKYPDYLTAQNNYAETLLMWGKTEEARKIIEEVKAKDEQTHDANFLSFYGL